MHKYKEFKYLLRKLQHSAAPSEAVVTLKDLATAVQSGDKSDLEELLSLLFFTPDYELKDKLLCILSAYLISHNGLNDVIVTYRPLYESVQNLLSRGSPIKTKTTLNFIRALLTNGTDTNNLTLFARNMLRVSGCLSTMCAIFISGMMYQDTWIALCQSIAECCSECEVNQSFCSHLVPVCVKRCCQGNTDVCIVLQCLLYNHQRNIELFFANGGQNVFTRQLLQYDVCMQMLSNIVQISEQAVQILYNSGLIQHLRDFLHLYGSCSQVGQWSTIVLYHFDNRIKAPVNAAKNMTNEKIVGNDAIPTNSNMSFRQPISKQISYKNDSKKLFAKKVMDHTNKDDITFSTLEKQKYNFGEEKTQPKNKLTTNDIYYTGSMDDDTINLFQNVIKEVFHWKSKNKFNPNTLYTQTTEANKYHHSEIRKSFTSTIENNKCHLNEIGEPFTPIIKSNKHHQNDIRKQFTPTIDTNKYQNENDDRFHKILNAELREHAMNDISFANLSRELDVNKEISLSFNDFKQNYNLTIQNKKLQTKGFKLNVSKTEHSFQYANTKRIENDMRDFRPSFVSTPKRRLMENTTIRSKTQTTAKTQNFNRTIRSCRSRINKQYKTNKSQVSQIIPNTTKNVKRRSMSARLFSAINESCTTLVKSVKSIFTSKKNYNKYNKHPNIVESDKYSDTASCSYSFTKYMLKRDVDMGNEQTRTENGEGDNSNSTYRYSCRTCKDSIVLQHKLTTDEHLQQTIKKLKIGVNLYGCDFKKISKTFWPRDRYMTPNTLYNLYRKLIMNGGYHKQKFSEKQSQVF